MTTEPSTIDSGIVASRAFADVFRAYQECSDAIQGAIRDMVDIVNDPEATPDEVEAAIATLSEALFPCCCGMSANARSAVGKRHRFITCPMSRE